MKLVLYLQRLAAAQLFLLEEVQHAKAGIFGAFQASPGATGKHPEHLNNMQEILDTCATILAWQQEGKGVEAHEELMKLLDITMYHPDDDEIADAGSVKQPAMTTGDVAKMFDH